MVWVVQSALELDGKLIPQSRLMRLSAIEVLNYAFADIMDGLDGKQRAMVLAGLEGRLGPNGGIIIDDPTLPAEMQGMEAPAWWDDGETDMSDTFSVG